MSHTNFTNSQHNRNRINTNFTSLNAMPLQRTISDGHQYIKSNSNLQRGMIKNTNGDKIKLYYKKPKNQINNSSNYANNPLKNPLNSQISYSNINQKSNSNLNLNLKQNSNFRNSNIKNNFQNSNVNMKNNNMNNFKQRATSQVIKKTSSFFDDNNSSIYNKQNKFFAQRKNSGIQKKINFVEFGTVNGKKQLIEKIEDKNKVVNQLSNNYKFFKEECEKRKDEFYKKMKYDIKGKIYDKVLKGNLHYISKYYDNLNKNQPEQAHNILQTNLKKTQKEINNLNENIKKIKFETDNKERELRSKVNEIGVIKIKKEIIGNLNKEEIEKKIEELKRENLVLESDYKELQIKEKKELYNLKFKHELKGRKMMEESALKLALENYDKNDFEQNSLVNKIRSILNDLEFKNKIKEDNYYYKLMEKKKKLEEEYQQLI